MPKVSARLARAKRSKTFTGCWTCRARHVKCDDVRPFCNRCAKSNIECEGYSIRLSWDAEGDNAKAAGKNRLQFSNADMRQPIFSEEEIDTALELLDSAEVGFAGLEARPYTVFSIVQGVGYDGDSYDIQQMDARLTLGDDASYVRARGDATFVGL